MGSLTTTTIVWNNIKELGLKHFNIQNAHNTAEILPQKKIEL